MLLIFFFCFLNTDCSLKNYRGVPDQSHFICKSQQISYFILEGHMEKPYWKVTHLILDLHGNIWN